MPELKTPKKLGRYKIVRELGRGAMGVVYEGHDPLVGRRVAIKTARRDLLESSPRTDELMERFLREARAAGALNHPNIVTIYDAGEEDGVAYIAMEFLDGTDLSKLIEKQRRFTVDETIRITATVCGALSHAHANGVIHRDIKPSNIVMLANGTLKVADFGIARVSDSQLTQEGSMIGTPHYMSPEQFMGHPVDGRSDVFSVGVILYELLTGEKPFFGNSLNAVMHKVLHVEPVPPRQLNYAVADCLSRIVMKALSKSPADRYASAGDLCAALQECLKENPDPAVTKVTGDAAGAGLAETVPMGGSATVVKAPAGESTVALQKLAGEVTEVHGDTTTIARGDPGSTEVSPGTPLGLKKPAWLSRRMMAASAGGLVVLAGLAAAVAALNGSAPETFASAEIAVYLAETPEEAAELEGDPSQGAPAARPEGYVTYRGAGGENIRIDLAFEGHVARVDFKEPLSKYTYDVVQSGYLNVSSERPIEAGREDRFEVLLLRDDEG